MTSLPFLKIVPICNSSTFWAILTFQGNVLKCKFYGVICYQWRIARNNWVRVARILIIIKIKIISEISRTINANLFPLNNALRLNTRPRLHLIGVGRPRQRFRIIY